MHVIELAPNRPGWYLPAWNELGLGDLTVGPVIKIEEQSEV